jgi:hypothetical protein
VIIPPPLSLSHSLTLSHSLSLSLSLSLREVISPQMGGGVLQYQRAPTLRVYTPSTSAMGKMHNDCDYNHQPSEINFWLPLTTVFGSNTMWVESEENKGDFHPLTMKYGL